MDIALALVIAGCQGVATWLAWRATADPIKGHQRRRKTRYSYILGVSCAIGFVATGFVTYSSRDVTNQLHDVSKRLHEVQGRLGESEKQLKEMHDNFAVTDLPTNAVSSYENNATPPTTDKSVIAVDPPSSGSGGGVRFQVDKVETRTLTVPTPTVGITIYVKNIGLPVKGLLIYSNQTLAETPINDTKQQKIINDLSEGQIFTHAYRIQTNDEYPIPMYVRKNERFWFTQQGPTISSDMFAAVQKGKYRVYFVGVLGSYYSYCYYVGGNLNKATQCSPAGPHLGLGGQPLSNSQ